jgi:hypothetical protein
MNLSLASRDQTVRSTMSTSQTILGNIVGGVSLVAALGHPQIVGAKN